MYSRYLHHLHLLTTLALSILIFSSLPAATEGDTTECDIQFKIVPKIYSQKIITSKITSFLCHPMTRKFLGDYSYRAFSHTTVTIHTDSLALQWALSHQEQSENYNVSINAGLYDRELGNTLLKNTPPRLLQHYRDLENASLSARQLYANLLLFHEYVHIIEMMSGNILTGHTFHTRLEVMFLLELFNQKIISPDVFYETFNLFEKKP